MENPATPAASEGVSLKPPSGGFGRQLSYHGSSPGTIRSEKKLGTESAPITPAKLADDPAIVLSIKSRDNSAAKRKSSEHARRDSTSTVKQYKLEPAFTADKTKTSMIERNWRGQNDPFTSGPDTASTQATAVDSEQDETEDEENDDDLKKPKSSTPEPREDRDTSHISAENAQGFFKATYCVFVANLAVGCPDQDLETETHKIFSKFGELWTKIRRDRNGMPYAFCQYTREEDADKALTAGHGLIVCGRPCRVERARANRSVYLSRTAGGIITEDQAREILKSTGPLEKLWYPTDTDKEVYRLADGIWATYTFFQDARDAQNAFRDSQEYRLEIPYSPEDHERNRTTRFKFSPLRSTPIRGGSRSSFRWPTPSGTSRSINTSIFVGNLPLSASIESIREGFETCGTVRTIEVVGKANGLGPGLTAFAFVEFTGETGARNALSREVRVGGRRLRIEPRESLDHVARSGFNTAGSPRNRVPLTPRTPINQDNLIKTSSPGTMMPIYEAGAPQTPMSQQMYAQPSYYGSPYAATYGGYYPPAQGDVAQAGLPQYAPMTGTQVMGSYSYPAYMTGQYPAGYSFPYVYPTPVHGDNSIGTATNNNGTAGTPVDITSASTTPTTSEFTT